MILNTGNRTDIPAFYSDWFYNRIEEGIVGVRNPYNPTLVTTYKLDPQLIDIIIFCTKNPLPMLDRLDKLNEYNQYWSITITPYGKDVEENVVDKNKVIRGLKTLSKKLGKNHVCWRYDPIFISDKYSLEYHLDIFNKMAKSMSGYVDTCVISFIDLYQKTIKNFPGIKEVTHDEKMIIGKAFSEIGKKYNIKIKTCLEGHELEKFGIDSSGCLNKEVIEKALEYKIDITKGMLPREGCNCLLTNDIGMYNTCLHFCRYCYANYDKQTVFKNNKLHDPNSILLVGNITPQDKIKESKQTLLKQKQLSLDI
ncbi:MAG: DUF1848 domain-containing protein [Thomasclavelia sp.]|nr:DUF1848 domain-containing protein [Thomasclavelia sp.]